MNKIISLKDLLIIYNLPSHLVAVITKEGKFEQVNASVARLLGYEEENLLGSEFSNIIHPDDHPDDLLNFYKEDDKDYTHAAIKRIRHSEGSYQSFSWHFTKLAGSSIVYAIAHSCDERPGANAMYYSKIKAQKYLQKTRNESRNAAEKQEMKRLIASRA